MADRQEKNVWIVGAGFSRHAGGPLMNELFSETADHFVDFDGMPLRDQLIRVGKLFRAFLPGGERKKTLWQDAEQFLERLDDLVLRNRPQSLIGELARFFWNPPPMGNIEELRWFVTARLCMEVNDYVEDLEMTSDRVSPYKHWIDRLDERDFILSFNYDMLIEKVSGETIEALAPHEAVDESNINLIKLHGSVDWARDRDDKWSRRATGNKWWALKDTLHSEVRPYIGMPGVSKGRFTTQFKGLWDYAENAIAGAQVIHIVGYRFPESDSVASLRLLNALRKNTSCPTVNIVLGSNEETPDVRRLSRLVKANLGENSKVNVLPMYAQDYLLLDGQAWHNPDPGSAYLI